MTKEVELMTKFYEMQTEMTGLFIKYFREQNVDLIRRNLTMLENMIAQMRIAATSTTT